METRILRMFTELICFVVFCYAAPLDTDGWPEDFKGQVMLSGPKDFNPLTKGGKWPEDDKEKKLLIKILGLSKSTTAAPTDGWPEGFKGQVMLSGPKDFNPLTKGGKWPEDEDEKKLLIKILGLSKSTTAAPTDGWPEDFKGQVMLSGPKDFNPFTKGGKWPENEEEKKLLMKIINIWKNSTGTSKDGWPDDFKGQVMLSGPKDFNPLTKGGKWPEDEEEKKVLMKILDLSKSTTTAPTDDGWPEGFKGQIMLSGPKDFNPLTKGGKWPEDEEERKKLKEIIDLWKNSKLTLKDDGWPEGFKGQVMLSGPNDFNPLTKGGKWPEDEEEKKVIMKIINLWKNSSKTSKDDGWPEGFKGQVMLSGPKDFNPFTKGGKLPEDAEEKKLLMKIIDLWRGSTVAPKNDGWPDDFKGQVMLSGPKDFNPLTKGGKWPEDEEEKKLLLKILGHSKSTTAAPTDDGWPDDFKGQVMLSGPKDFNPLTKGGKLPENEEEKKLLTKIIDLWKGSTVAPPADGWPSGFKGQVMLSGPKDFNPLTKGGKLPEEAKRKHREIHDLWKKLKSLI